MKKLINIIFLLLIVFNTNAQTYFSTVKLTQTVIDGNTLKAPAGSVIGLEPGIHAALFIKNLHNVTIINKGGQAIFDNGTGSGIAFYNCSNIKLTGTGSSDHQYGIVIQTGQNGLVVTSNSTDFEIDHIEIKNTKFAGIMAKTDPDCNNTLSYQPNFVMKNLSIHNNYIHDVPGEGLYIGNSFFASGRSLSCGLKYPHPIQGLKVYNNITYNTGCEGIQVGSANKDCEIYNNVVENYGLKPFDSSQDNGIQIGEGTTGKCYNNLIKNGKGNGIIVLGVGDNLIYNNIIYNTGEYGIFVDDRLTYTPTVKIINNTIINSKLNGIHLYSDVITTILANNLIINPKNSKYITKLNNNVKTIEYNNLFSVDTTIIDSNFRLVSKSSPIDAGALVESFEITTDFYGAVRLQGSSVDVGATEYIKTLCSCCGKSLE